MVLRTHSHGSSELEVPDLLRLPRQPAQRRREAARNRQHDAGRDDQQGDSNQHALVADPIDVGEQLGPRDQRRQRDILTSAGRHRRHRGKPLFSCHIQYEPSAVLPSFEMGREGRIDGVVELAETGHRNPARRSVAAHRHPELGSRHGNDSVRGIEDGDLGRRRDPLLCEIDGQS